MTILLAVATVSAAILAYEVLLMRLFAIVQWHHFAYMIISIALLGFGASGSFLSLAGAWLKPRFTAAFAASAALFGITALAAFALGQRLPFNALEVVWDPGQLLYLLALYALFTLPFFCGATCIGLAFARFGPRIPRIYRYDLTGAGIGALGIVGALFLVSPEDSLRLIAALGPAAAGLVCLGGEGRRRAWAAAAFFAAGPAFALAMPASWTELRLSPYKGLSKTIAVPGSLLIGEYSSPLGLLSVVRSGSIPLRHVAGLSLNNRIEPPDQLAVFTDGDAMSVITADDGRAEALGYLDFTTAALPYHLLERPAVLVLGAGGGGDVLRAVTLHAARVDAVELNPQMVRLVRDLHGGFAGGLYSRPDVRVHLAEARGFVAGRGGAWDLIEIPLLDSFGAAAAGVHSLSESYIYTEEAFRAYLRRLRPGGYLSITRWLKLPPRDSLKLLATARAALEAEGDASPERRLALIRSWDTTTLLVKNGDLSSTEVAAIRAFADERAFDLAYVPGITPAEGNRWNRLERPYFLEGATALLGAGRDDFLAGYKFDIAPTRDDRPYFFDFFKWRSLPEILALRLQGGAALLEWGYPILFATLLQAAVLSLLLILLPLGLGRLAAGKGVRRGRLAAYIAALGLAFLFIEIAFIQRFILFLSHPLYAVAVVLAGFLVFAGLGSGLAPRFADWLAGPRTRWPAWLAGRTAVEWAVLGIGLIALAYLLILPPLFDWLMPLPDWAKVLLALALIAPLAFWMGMPFPLGLARVSENQPSFVPWAWGINGCTSVLSAILATILAIHFGFAAVVVIAVLLYLAAAAVSRGAFAAA